MDTLLLILIIAAEWGFVIYRLFSGSKIKVETLRNSYNWISIVCVIATAVVIIINEQTVYSIILAIASALAYILFTCIPSGYNDEAIFVRGLRCPYNKITDTKKEYIKDIYRFNFKYRHRFYYIDVKEGNEKIINECEQLYKKGRDKK